MPSHASTKGNDTMSNRDPSRRDFSRTALAGVAGLTAASYARAAGAGKRITFGVIGCGGMGTGHLSNLVKRGAKSSLAVAAVCDVYQRRLTRAEKISSARGYRDYRPLLDRKDLDAVLIATPDHWHAKLSIEALESGKHVYVEKPMTLTVEQALAVRDKVRATKKVLQVGPNATAGDGYWQAHEAIKAGRIGKVTWAQASYNRNARTCLFNTHQRIDPGAGPDKAGEDHIDWDMWLGHKWGLAPKIDWNPEHFFRFRKYWPYNGGVATDLLYHKLAPLLLAITGPSGAYPLRVNACGGLYIEKDGRDIPDTFLLTADYPQEFSVFLVSTLTNDAQLPDRVYGKHGTMDLGGTPTLRFNGDFKKEFQAKNDGKDEVSLALRPRPDMVGNFIDVIRDGGTLHCGADLGAATMVAIKLAVESYRQRKTMTWDAHKEKVVSG
jgi:predicted dehydrogenase